MLRQTLLDFFFPPLCCGCNTLLQEADAVFCPRCLGTLPWRNGDDTVQAGASFILCLSAGRYVGGLRKAVLQYKFQGQKQLATFFAKPMADLISQYLDGQYTCISWIPLSKKRLRKRGYNQSHLLAEAVARELGQVAVPLLDHPRPKKAQSTLRSAAARASNVRGCFTVPDPALVQDARVLLIDDVITTGATLEEAALTLKHAGAAAVLCATICRTAAGQELGQEDNPNHQI